MNDRSNSNNEIPKYMRVRELAKYLGIGKSTIWLYARKGIIKGNKVSSYITLFEVAEVEKALIGKGEN